MSLQGTGSSSKYWLGAGPFSSYANRPFTLAVWVNSAESGNEGIVQIANSGYGAGIQLIPTWPQLIDGNDAGSHDYCFCPGLVASSWQFVVAVFAASGGTNYIYLNGTTDPKYGSTPAIAGTTTYGAVAVGIGTGLYAAATTLIGELSIWSGALSAADIGKLYNGGAGGKGLNPRNLISTGGALLERYYLPVGGTDFLDHSGKAGATLAAQGGAVATWNSSNPPVAMVATVGTVVGLPPLVSSLW